MILKKVINLLENISKKTSMLNDGIMKVSLSYEDDITVTIKDDKIKEEPLSDTQSGLVSLLRAKKILCDEYKLPIEREISIVIKTIEDKILAKEYPVE